MTGDGLSARDVGERIEHLLGALRAADPSTAATGEELVGVLMRLYGEGMGRMVGQLEPDEVRRLALDPVVTSLLVLHELHPDDTNTRVEAALERVRPYLGSHAGGVEFLGVDEAGVARLRLQGSCDGCPSSRVTVEMALEGAVLDAAPEVVAVEVEGVAADPDPQLLQIGRKPAPREPTWVVLEGPVPPPGRMETRSMGSFDILVASAGEQTYAHRDDCPACGTPMIDGRLDGTLVSCAGCPRRYDLAAAGRSLDDGLILDPVPLITEGGSAKVALEVGVAT